MTKPSADSLLFQPIKIGGYEISNRIVQAPCGRYRATRAKVPLIPLVPTYYAQRASYPGTLLITEATLISPRASGDAYSPGIWSDAQVAAWRAVTSAVHANGSRIFLQLWAQGRMAVPEELATEAEIAGLPRDAFAVSSASAIPFSVPKTSPLPFAGLTTTPKELTEDEIAGFVADYAAAARRAVFDAGFDGVEVHGANGYLPDQFTQDVTNQRTDRYGGSIENRSRFALEVMSAIVDAVGPERSAIRLSPWNKLVGMGMREPMGQFSHLVGELKKLRLAYLHLIEPRVEGFIDIVSESEETNEPLVKLWGRTSPVFLAGGNKPEMAVNLVEKYKDVADVMVVFGRHFIANPDLVYRIKNGIPLNKYDRSTFYTPHQAEGYTDYPFSEKWHEERADCIVKIPASVRA